MKSNTKKILINDHDGALMTQVPVIKEKSKEDIENEKKEKEEMNKQENKEKIYYLKKRKKLIKKIKQYNK